MAIQILSSTQTTSDEYEAAGTRARGGSVILADHAGGTWKLQVQYPGDSDTWVDTGVEFDDDGVQGALDFVQGWRYRLTGGTVGAKASIAEFS